jgi:hypothetical protein
MDQLIAEFNLNNSKVTLSECWTYVDEKLALIRNQTNGQEWINLNITLFEYLLYGPKVWLTNNSFRAIVKHTILQTEIVTLLYFKNLGGSPQSFEPQSIRDLLDFSPDAVERRTMVDLVDLLDDINHYHLVETHSRQR